MAAPTNELRAHRRGTKDFIFANYTDIALVPRTKLRTGSGVAWTEGTPRASQRFRLIDLSGTQTFITADGKQRKVEYQLLGAYDAVIGMYDIWKDAAGIRWEVADLLPSNGYEVRALVVRYGE